MRTLDRKLEAIVAGDGSPDHVVIADAKDADTALGIPTVGRRGDAQIAAGGRTRQPRHRIPTTTAVGEGPQL